jgi:ABC-type sugar transport system permease subunit
MRARYLPYILFAPALVILAAIALYPIYYAVDVSFYQTSYLRKVRFVGFDNYIRLLSNPAFIEATWTSVKFAVGSIVLTIPLAMVFALALNEPIRFRTFFRTVLIIPWALSQSVTGMLWAWMLNPSYGPVKYLFEKFGFDNAVFLSNPDGAIWILVLENTWMSYPLAMVLFIAALQTVPGELYEAAKIDGCSALRSFWHVTLPSIKGTIMTTTIMTTLQFFNIVTLIYVMTGGGPMGSTRTLSVMVFLEGFFNFRLATAAAVGMVIFFLNIVFSLSYIRVLRQSHLQP